MYGKPLCGGREVGKGRCITPLCPPPAATGEGRKGWIEAQGSVKSEEGGRGGELGARSLAEGRRSAAYGGTHR